MTRSISPSLCTTTTHPPPTSTPKGGRSPTPPSRALGKVQKILMGYLGKVVGQPKRRGREGGLWSLHPLHASLHLSNLTLALPHCKRI